MSPASTNDSTTSTSGAAEVPIAAASESNSYAAPVQRFEGKVVLLTGAGSGMGQAISVRLASEGATVVGLDINESGLAETGSQIEAAASGSFSGSVVDITNVAAAQAAVTDVVGAHGQLDVLGNIAGIHPALSAMSEITEADWDAYNDVNLKAVFFLSQAALPHLIEANGNIVNIASNAGLSGLAYCVPYCATKGGVVQLTKSMAMEFIKASVRINAIAPGGTHTAIVDNIEIRGEIDFDLVARYTSPRPLDTPQSVAALFAHIASDEAANMHGSIVAADSGLTAG